MELVNKKYLTNYYDSLESLPIYNWDKYISSRDLNCFLKDFDSNQTRIHDKILKEIEVKLLDEYFIAKNEEEFTLKLQKCAKIDNLNLIYNLVSAMIQTMLASLSLECLKMKNETRYSYIDKLNSFGLSIPKYNTLEGDKMELNRINKEKESMKNQIRLLENELKVEGIDVTKDSFGIAFDIIANDWLKNKETSETHSLDETLRKSSTLLGGRTNVNPNEIVVLKWIELCKKN